MSAQTTEDSSHPQLTPELAISKIKQALFQDNIPRNPKAEAEFARLQLLICSKPEELLDHLLASDSPDTVLAYLQCIREEELQWADMDCSVDSIASCTWKHPQLIEALQELGAPDFSEYWEQHEWSFCTMASSLMTRVDDIDGDIDCRERLIKLFVDHAAVLARDGMHNVWHGPQTKLITDKSLRSYGAGTTNAGLCIIPPSMQVDASNIYQFMYGSHERLSVATGCDYPTLEAVNRTAEVQMVDRAGMALAAKSLQRLMFGSVLSWGSHIKSMVAAARHPAGTTAVCSEWLQLADFERPTGDPDYYYLKADSPAIQDLTFLAWLAVHEYVRLQKQTGCIPHKLLTVPDFELVVTPSTVSGSRPNQPIRVHITSFHRGICSGIVTSTARNERVLIKVGREVELQALALHVGLAWEPFYQVEREVATRSQLQEPVRNLAPLYATGTITAVNSSSGSSDLLAGRSVLVMLQTGQPLVAEGCSLPVLPLQEAMVLLRCLTAAVLDLHAQGVRHGDIKPHNVGVGDGFYYLYDLGFSVSAAANRLGWAVLRGRQDPEITLLPDYCRVHDLMYSSLSTLQHKLGNIVCEVQSAVFTAYVLAGNQLPWAAAAAANDHSTAIKLRSKSATDSSLLPSILSWPQMERQLALAALACDVDSVLHLAQQVVAGTACMHV